MQNLVPIKLPFIWRFAHLALWSRVSLVRFPSGNSQPPPPPRGCFWSNPPWARKKIARYLVLNAQKMAKNKGSKKFYPLKPRFLDDSRGVYEGGRKVVKETLLWSFRSPCLRRLSLGFSRDWVPLSNIWFTLDMWFKLH